MFPHAELSRRERQIMELLYRAPAASVAEILAGIPDPPGYSAVRALVNILERKGYLSHVKEGKKYLYSSLTSRRVEMEGALRHLLRVYFDNSLEQAVAAMVRLHAQDLGPADMRRLERAVRAQKGKRAAP
jgi:BlaI family penicillinase repressor